jgi:hypothetical protein
VPEPDRARDALAIVRQPNEAVALLLDEALTLESPQRTHDARVGDVHPRRDVLDPGDTRVTAQLADHLDVVLQLRAERGRDHGVS